MNAIRCSCGFAELADETVIDHLLRVFEPEGSRGTDGLVHEEVAPPRTCSCGFTAMTPADVDSHFLRVFTPPGAVGRDGKKHEACGGDEHRDDSAIRRTSTRRDVREKGREHAGN